MKQLPEAGREKEIPTQLDPPGWKLTNNREKRMLIKKSEYS